MSAPATTTPTTPAPAAPASTGDADAANQRASAAEARLAEIAAREKAQEDAAAKAKKDADLKTSDDSKRAMEAAEKREKDALGKLKAYEDKQRTRITESMKGLDDATKKRLGSLGEKVDLDEWESWVSAEVARSGDGAPAGDGTVVAPPVTNPSRGTKMAVDGKRDLPPRAMEILDDIGVDADASRSLTKVIKSDETGKEIIVFPKKLLIKKIKERAQQPRRLTKENADKLYSGR